MAAGLEFKLTGEAFSNSLLPIPAQRQRLQRLVPESGGFEALSHPAGKVWSVVNSSSGGQDSVLPPEELQEVLWQQYFADQTQWWDDRQSKPTPQHPDFRHKKSKLALWLDNPHKPAWVDSQLARLHTGRKKTPAPVSTTVQGQGELTAHEGDLEMAMCRKLCQDGRISDAVDALDLLVERGRHVHNNLFYCVLKWCISHKDLALGRHIHALTLKSGYEGDAFLTTHLIGLYASHGRLEEAMRVFNKVSVPDAYNWASIILAYSRHGEAAEAIGLYQKMRESTTVEPDNRIYVAVLKACAAAEDLVAGKEVHVHILASPGKPDIFVHTGLVDMYAKCGRLEDARRVFDRVPAKNVVIWTAMIAGYAQQGMGREALSLYSSMQLEGLNPNSVTYVCLLQACASVGVGALDEGKRLHAQIKERGLQFDVILGGSLVNMYVKCGSLEDARRVFERLPARNVVAWNAILRGYAQRGMGREALSLYTRMQEDSLSRPDSVTYVCLLQACANVGPGALLQGKQLHAEIREKGLHDDPILACSLVNMYVECGSLEDARRAFDKFPTRDVVTWTAMIAGYAQQGMGQAALTLYKSMQQEGLSHPDSVTYNCLLRACGSVGVGALLQGKQLHAEIQEKGLEVDFALACSLVDMYAKCGSLEDARSLFDMLPARDVVTWTVMIARYAQQGLGEDALSLYNNMQLEGLSPPDSVTYVSLLQACASVGAGALHQGKQLHAQIQERGLEDDVLGGSLVNMYAKCGSLEDARRVFDILRTRGVATWTAMIACYVRQGMGQKALSLYSSMQAEGCSSPESVTFASLLQACADVGAGALRKGKELHRQIEERGLLDDALLGGSLVKMYAKCSSLEDARRVFDRLPKRTLATWTSMIAGYAQQGMGQEALRLYRSMQQEGLSPPDLVTYVCLLQACSSVGIEALLQGKQLHAEIQERGLPEDVVLGSSLVNMYAKCGSLDDARSVFDILPVRDVVTWTAMIAGYVQQEMGQEALCLYSRMRVESLTAPNAVTYACVLQACADVAALPLGKQLHAEIEKQGMQADALVGSALVNMYAKCGSMLESQQVFDSLPERSVEVWGALISGYAHQGNSDVVFNLFDRMRVEGIQPDAITFLSVLTVCSHVGLVDKGRNYFEEMTSTYGISATIEHFTCMMDILGRAGYLDDALQMVKTMPFPPNDVVWHTLLGACQKWKNVEIGQQAFEGALSVDGQNAASYVLMSNIYASVRMLEAAKDMQARRTTLGAWKKPGQSWWTDMGGVVHTFVVGDKKHPESEGIYARLEQLVPRLKEEGYVTPALLVTGCIC